MLASAIFTGILVKCMGISEQKRKLRQENYFLVEIQYVPAAPVQLTYSSGDIVLSQLVVVHKRLERHNLASNLEVEKHVDEVVVELRGEGLIIHQHHVGPLKGLEYRFVLTEIAPLEVDLSGRYPPQPAAGGEFLFLRVGEVAGVFHHFAPPTFAAYFKGCLEHDVANAGSQIDKNHVRGQLGALENVRDEGVEELAVDIVGAVFVLGEELDFGGNGAVVYLV
ncbi:hypothetical protein QC761_0106150 [Podospora bellae-mahoneyi]|uniref:Uncharacterized protein n=1 Tax=Podospora bellae-mahoneyi TaxID=2093777 RepID=A0ABR0F821_9PEZI|nr:hypothetical protein QC761_0106150 [Podospora bellae-mahoneyi]